MHRAFTFLKINCYQIEKQWFVSLKIYSKPCETAAETTQGKEQGDENNM